MTPAECAKTIRTLLMSGESAALNGQSTVLQLLALEQYLALYAAQIAEWLEKYETD